jgi:hypothetical protein
MTTQREMEMACTAQQEVIVALRSTGEVDLADRLEGCMIARRQRHYGDGWPRTCRSAGCVWCRRAMIRGWWNGMCQWSAEAATSSLVIIRVHSPEGLHNVVRRLRRSLRDVRDRMARHRRSWRNVGFAGMAGGDGRVLAMITHEGIDRREVQDALHRRWPDLVMKCLEQEAPTVAMTAEDAANLGQCRRGVEPMRVVIMPQHDRQPITSPVLDPMPVLV